MKPKIYYLDDEPDLVSLFEDLFSSSAYEIRTFIRSDELFKVVAEEPADLYILDYRMPQTNGLEISRLLPPNSKKILITGELYLDPPQDFICCLEKPFHIEKMRALLKDFAANFKHE